MEVSIIKKSLYATSTLIIISSQPQSNLFYWVEVSNFEFVKFTKKLCKKKLEALFSISKDIFLPYKREDTSSCTAKAIILRLFFRHFMAWFSISALFQSIKHKSPTSKTTNYFLSCIPNTFLSKSVTRLTGSFLINFSSFSIM